MNFSRKKMILYMLIIASGIDTILPGPIFQNKEDANVQTSVLDETRFSRQVVQPTWLNLGQEAAMDPTVYVDQRALEEADEIRRTIQKAVNEDTFAVPDEQQDPNMDPNFNPSDQGPPQPMHSLPPWYQNVQRLFQNWSQNLFRGFRN
ncbi:uncharacterized protein LOC135958677 [Calliphora vicina]|uniref:uncharacterized protein LOC135958677 n=1 Tax=Calliphora vicina TaxID=7373 RepID=UPI00325B4A87